MLKVAVISNGMVVNMVGFADEDRDLVATFDFESSAGEGAYGVIVEDDMFAGIGFKYENGIFIAPPMPEPTHEQLVNQAEQEKNQRLSSANSIFLEWQTKLLLNIASDDEKNAVIAWVNYKDAVRAVDTQQAPNITWPEQPPIPEDAK